jgi:hypothetical protein
MLALNLKHIAMTTDNHIYDHLGDGHHLDGHDLHNSHAHEIHTPDNTVDHTIDISHHHAHEPGIFTPQAPHLADPHHTSPVHTPAAGVHAPANQAASDIGKIDNIIHKVDHASHKAEELLERAHEKGYSKAINSALDKFSKLHWSKKTAIIGGTVAAAGAIGYWVHNHSQRKPEKKSFVDNLNTERANNPTGHIR